MKSTINGLLIWICLILFAGILFLFALNGRYYIAKSYDKRWTGVDKWTGRIVEGNIDEVLSGDRLRAIWKIRADEDDKWMQQALSDTTKTSIQFE